MCGSWTQKQYRQAGLVIEELVDDKGQTAIIGSGSNGVDVYNVYDGRGQDSENFALGYRQERGFYQQTRQDQLDQAHQAMAQRGFHPVVEAEPAKEPVIEPAQGDLVLSF